MFINVILKLTTNPPAERAVVNVKGAKSPLCVLWRDLVQQWTFTDC